MVKPVNFRLPADTLADIDRIKDFQALPNRTAVLIWLARQEARKIEAKQPPKNNRKKVG